MEKKIKYEEALTELENIVRSMENDELDVDNLTVQLKQAQRLIKLCKDRLKAVDAEIKKTLNNSDEAKNIYYFSRK